MKPTSNRPDDELELLARATLLLRLDQHPAALLLTTVNPDGRLTLELVDHPAFGRRFEVSGSIERIVETLAQRLETAWT